MIQIASLNTNKVIAESSGALKMQDQGFKSRYKRDGVLKAQSFDRLNANGTVMNQHSIPVTFSGQPFASAGGEGIISGISGRQVVQGFVNVNSNVNSNNQRSNQ